MSNAEAKLILASLRPDGPEAAQAPFLEALARAESDPELKAWWEAWQDLDRQVAAKVAEVPVPDDLRAAILSGRKVASSRPRMQYSSWLAAAAMLGILCVAGVFWQVANLGPVDKGDYISQILPVLGHDEPHLALTSDNRKILDAWLKAQHAPLGTMPPKVAAMPTVGCQKYVVHGHNVSLICFALAGGGVVHLFTVEKSALNDPPGVNTPEFDNIQGWNIASWSDDHMAYMLATTSSSDALKQLL